MASEKDICVLGLRLLGQAADIAGLAENSVYADMASAAYPVVRDALLEHHAWNFATTTVRLQPIREKPVGWGSAYALPSDCIRALHVATDPTPPRPKPPLPPAPGETPPTPPPTPKRPPFYGPNRQVRPGTDVSLSDVFLGSIESWDYMPWAVEMLGPRRVVLTEMPSPVLKYVRKVTNPDFFSPGFTNALAWHLAAFLAGPVIKSDTGMTVSAKLLQSATAYERTAIQLEANTGRGTAYRPDAPWYR